MNAKLKFLLILLVCVSANTRADSFTTNTPYDELVFHVVRYGNTEAKRRDKDQARKELFSRRADALRFVMTKIHVDNVGLQVLAQNMVEEFKKDEVVPVLLDFIEDARTNTQKTAIYFLGFHPAPEHARKIKPFLASDKLRGVTIRTLGKWKAADALPEIAAFLRDDNERVRVAAANALRDIGDPRAVPYLIDAQADPVFTVRNTALRALVSFGEAGEKAMLAQLEKAKGVPLRQFIRGLGELRSVAAEKPLHKLADGQDTMIRDDARCALLFINPSALR